MSRAVPETRTRRRARGRRLRQPGADRNQGQLPAGALLVAAVLRRRREGLVRRGRPQAGLQHLPGRRAADRRLGVEVVGRRRHRVGAGGARRGALQPADDRLTNDESVGNALMATGATAEGFVKNPQSIKGQTIVLTANSTGDYAVQSCLAKWGLKKSDVTMKSMGQAEIISAMSTKQRRPRRAVGAEHLHDRGEGGREADLLGQGRRRDRTRRARSCAPITRRSSRRTSRSSSPCTSAPGSG